MTPDEVRALARSVPERWYELEFIHRSSYLDVQAIVRHGELDGVRLEDGHPISVRGAPPSPWTVRPLEPYATNYQWSAMLDPYELGDGVDISHVHNAELFGRPAVAFTARATEGYAPVCSCCPLVYSTASQRLEHGESWVDHNDNKVPDHVNLALDAEVGIVVSSYDLDSVNGGSGAWYTNQILRFG